MPISTSKMIKARTNANLLTTPRTFAGWPCASPRLLLQQGRRTGRNRPAPSAARTLQPCLPLRAGRWRALTWKRCSQAQHSPRHFADIRVQSHRGFGAEELDSRVVLVHCPQKYSLSDQSSDKWALRCARTPRSSASSHRPCRCTGPPFSLIAKANCQRGLLFSPPLTSGRIQRWYDSMESAIPQTA
jgi:hypothetical protein